MSTPVTTTVTAVHIGAPSNATPSDPFDKGKRIGRVGIWMVGTLFGVVGLWLVFAPLNAAVIVPAQVQVENYRKTVQHLEGGIVQAVLVKSGDKVSQGQPLVRLEEVQADAAVESLQDQLDAEQARSARADAERLRRSTLTFPADLATRAPASDKLRSLLSAEAELFSARLRQLTGQTALLRSQADQVRAEIEGLQQQIASADINRKLIAAELEMNRELFKQAYVQQTRLMIFERALADKDEARGQYNAEHAVAQQKLVELDLKVISLEDEYVKRASDEYSEANRRVLELRERLRPIANALARQVVVAPAAGEVVGLKIHTAGAVISPGEVLMEIVPEQPVLLIEGKARPEDIADLALGQQVDIQVTAFKQRATPLLTGRLAYVSADSMAESINGMSVAYYLIQVAVDEESVKGLPSPLGPGMPATLFIQTRARTALDYLLQPLTDSMQKAFREH